MLTANPNALPVPIVLLLLLLALLAAALLVAIWRSGWRAAWRKPLVLGLAAAALVWGAICAAIFMMENAALPTVPLTTLAGEPTDLAKLAAGQPLVVNLWATWCPPCRSEMPVLAAAQEHEADVRFVFVNQGEDGATAQRYLSAARLEMDNVVLDPGAGLGRAIGSMGLPTTLFYDASGRQVDSHLGAITDATLANKLNRLRSRAGRK